MNRAGVVAAVLNRPGTLGPASGRRSRGELPLLALEHDSAAAAARAIGQLDAADWRGFNMVVADHSGGWFIRGMERGQPDVLPLPPGTSMVTAHDPNDLDSPRTKRHLPRLRAAEPPAPDNWAGWRKILSDQSGQPGEQINVMPRGGFGTVCSSYIALQQQSPPLWLFAAGAPHQAAFRPVFCEADSLAISATPPQAVST